MLQAEGGRRSLHQNISSGYDVAVRSRVTMPPEYPPEAVTATVTQLKNDLTTKGTAAFTPEFLEQFKVQEVKEARDITEEVKAGTVQVAGGTCLHALRTPQPTHISCATRPPSLCLHASCDDE